MKLGSRETFKNLKHRIGLDKAPLYKAKKYTTLRKVQLEESGVLAKKRHDYVKLFQTFTQGVIPAMERRVEYDLLKHQFRTLQDETVKGSLIQGYLRRMVQLREQEIRAGEIISNPVDREAEIPDFSGSLAIRAPLKYVGQEDIGLFARFQLPEIKKYFKHTTPGDFARDFIVPTKNFAVQMTDEGVKIIDYMRHNIRDDGIWERLLKQQNLADAVYDESTFLRLFATIRGDIWQNFEKYRNDEQMHRLFVNSPAFDSIVSVIINQISKNKDLLQSLADSKRRTQMFGTIFDQIKGKLDPEQLNSQLPYLFHETVKSLQLGDFNVDLTQYVEQPFHVPESFTKFRFENFVNCGNTALVYGNQGTGKTGVILQTAMYGHKSGWVVICVPSGYKWTQEDTDIERHHDTGLYLQPKFASEFLDQIGEANKELFQQIPVNLELWGKYNLSGVHDNDVTAVPNHYDTDRKYHFNDHEQFLEKEELAAMAEQQIAYDTRLSHKLLPKPRNLYDIVEAARAHPLYATSAIYEILEQLYKQDKYPVLVAVDGMNWFYRPSSHPSFRYESDPGLKGYIPPYHISLCRAFMHLDGHKIRNGYKVLSSQIYPMQGHVFTPEMIHYPKNYCLELKGAPLDHFRNYCTFWSQNKAWAGDEIQQKDLEQFFMETQGNLGETSRLMRINWRAIY